MNTKTMKHHQQHYASMGNPWSARADQVQSATGVLLGCFLLAHLHFESSILLGKEVFYRVVQFLEGGMFTSSGHGMPIVTQIFSVFVLFVVVLHAAMALRRFPVQLGQWRALRRNLQVINHKETTIWFWQMITGFILFFLAPVHIFTMITNPEIGPHLSAERVYHDNVWLLYALLLPAVVIHAMVGLYRVAVKWGVVNRRSALRKTIKILIIYLMVLGTASLISYLLIGSELSFPVQPFVPH
ncbi:fumarate reductase cytochrome b subunit [Shewanella sp. AS1]|uniref:fumarate reductase cytochrome b subunit n=1 Tax=Shewanella sp. AS1 TaxID=2907626 RepID=UPI001F2E633E|nr:fumarate reductase cytochrome b subunit [Shewanella sp. AS1]MCE9680477.1 fumarate reductase cytochrome b subunit [Shewanella sp. AS1]